MKGAFTGEAATNITGQTLHNMFRLNFGNRLFKLSDKSKDKTRDELKNLRLVIIDEYSMLSSDMLYQIHLRLQKITMRPEDPFGRVTVILLGNIIQLPPVNGRFIFEEPAWPDYKKGHIWQRLWDLFTVVKLRHNHRQAGQAIFAEMLKRIARGIKLPEDMELLKTRVFHKDDPAIPKNSLHVFPKLVSVNEYNHKMLNETEGELEVLTSKNIMPTRKEFNPKIDKDGKVDKTSLDHVLYLKKDVRVVLVHNIDVSDGLNNGAKGKVLDFIRDQNGIVTQVVVQFDIPETGNKLTETQTIAFKSQYPLGTPISKL